MGAVLKKNMRISIKFLLLKVTTNYVYVWDAYMQMVPRWESLAEGTLNYLSEWLLHMRQERLREGL